MFNKIKCIQQKLLDYSIGGIAILLLVTCIDISEGNSLRVLEQHTFLTDNKSGDNKWFRYIQRFLQNTHNKYFQNERRPSYIPTIINEKISIKFWQKITKNIKLSYWTGEQIENATKIHPLSKLRRLGQREDLKINHPPKAYYYQIFTWKFSLSNYFRLNITFDHISIMYGKLQQCYIGNISVKSFAKNLSQQFNYCGIHSNVKIYPWYQNINIQISLRPHVFYDIFLTYSMIVPNNIISYPKNKHSQSVEVISFVHFPKNRIYNLRLHIQVEKLNFIVLTFLGINSGTHKIDDGPDHLSNQLKLNNRSIVTT